MPTLRNAALAWTRDRRRAARALLVVVAIPGARTAAQEWAGDIPTHPFPRPGGRYQVGVVEWLWLDRERPEPYTRDSSDRRRLPVTVWYPAEHPSGARRAPYVMTPAQFGPGEPFKAIAHVRTNSVAGAPLAKGERTFPVLIYSHGAGATRFTGTFITELLASHGYVVFSLGHPGLDRTVVFSDGTLFKADTLAPPPRDPKLDPFASAARAVEFIETVSFPIWLDDSRFALDRIVELNAAPGLFSGRLDLDRIGMLGWSFGGATAVEMARVDPRVKAAVNHDGRLFGGTRSQAVRRPFMLLHRGTDDVAEAPEAEREVVRAQLAIMRSEERVARERATAEWYDLTIAGADHRHFSDLPLFFAGYRDNTRLSARRAHQIISHYTLAFFDRYLKGRAGGVLAAPAPPYAEVTLRRGGGDAAPRSR